MNKLKPKYKITIGVSLASLLVAVYLNWKYEVISFHPLWGNGKSELTVMTWNVHCSYGADSTKQRRIAELILEEDADFVQLNEYNQDSCLVIDTLLKIRYQFTEEYQSHRKCGDIFYCKRNMVNSGHVYTPPQTKGIQTIKATIPMGNDSVQILGVHMTSNHYDGISIEKVFIKGSSPYCRYKNAQEDRNFEAHWTKEEALKTKYPVIIMGDMNDFNCSAPLDTFSTCGLKDAWWEGGFGYGATFHDGWLRLRIDHILHSKELKLESIKVIETDLSDHNPVVAGFSIKEN